MNEEITTIITGLGILVMLYCLWSAFSLKAKVPGGVVGKKRQSCQSCDAHGFEHATSGCPDSTFGEALGGHRRRRHRGH